MPIMKIFDKNDHTVYVPNPHQVVQIYDTTYPDTHFEAEKDARLPGCIMQMTSQPGLGSIPILNFSARQIKRTIQEKVDGGIGFLKMFFNSNYISKGTRYVNLEHVAFLRHKEGTKPYILLDNDQWENNQTFHRIILEDDPLTIALQMRRVINRLDQDEELCCAAPPEEDDSEE